MTAPQRGCLRSQSVGWASPTSSFNKCKRSNMLYIEGNFLELRGRCPPYLAVAGVASRPLSPGCSGRRRMQRPPVRCYWVPLRIFHGSLKACRLGHACAFWRLPRVLGVPPTGCGLNDRASPGLPALTAMSHTTASALHNAKISFDNCHQGHLNLTLPNSTADWTVQFNRVYLPRRSIDGFGMQRLAADKR